MSTPPLPKQSHLIEVILDAKHLSCGLAPFTQKEKEVMAASESYTIESITPLGKAGWRIVYRSLKVAS